MTATTAPWYWEDGYFDHDAVGLVACVGDSGRIHYARAGERATACNQYNKNLRLLHGPKIVTCRNCCAVARGPNRGVIDQRYLKGVVASASRENFINRERARLAAGKARKV